MIVSLSEFAKGNVDLAGALAIILLASEFFIPLRLLGSFFHIAMNGMAASDKIFTLLDLPQPEEKGEVLANVVGSDRIYMLENGHVVQAGTHEELLTAGGAYEKLYRYQSELEAYGKEDRKAVAD